MNFDKKIQRQNTNCVKYDNLNVFFGTEDVLPLWVADMDFEVPSCISKAIKERAEHKIYGYSFRSDKCINAAISWIKKKHQWTVNKEWVTSSPGVVTALSISVMSLTEPGDKIIIQSPVYPPFYGVVNDNNRTLLNNKLIFKDGRYTMDFENLEYLARQGAKMIILCNPHNPIGRVWTKDELIKLGEICKIHDILILSDEIHCDLVFKDFKHIPIASLSEDLASRTICCMAASKTFNIAGLASSIIIIPNKDLRDKFNQQLEALHLNLGNLFGHTAMEAAYLYGEEWLKQLMDYIEKNADFVKEFLGKNLPQVKYIKTEATYLLWLDFSAFDMNDKDLQTFMVNKAKLALNPGINFGEGGEKFLRMNIACPRATLQEGLDRLLKASK